MIYLTAQPDEFYFTWQLELQLFNFYQLGIKPKDIHVLIGYDEKKGLRDYFKELIENNKDKASFYTYPDLREKKNYASSLRPYLIQRHFLKYPWLEGENIFYHDSDIVFRELPDFTSLVNGDTWYVSNTRDYLDSGYLKQFLDEDTFNALCKIVGVSPVKVIENDPNCGGAQYLLKKVPSSFWNKMEKDCEAVYDFLSEFNKTKESAFQEQCGYHEEYNGIQAWCADMWCLFWNALLYKKDIKVSKELDFCWATSDISAWNRMKILHYSGAVEKEDTNHFRKLNYVNFSPVFDIKLKKVIKSSASISLVNIIDQYAENMRDKRINIEDVSFLIPVRIDSESRLENLYIVTHYLKKYFHTSILIGESDITSKIDLSLLPTSCGYYFLEDHNKLLHRTRVNNFLIRQSRTPIIVIYDTDVVLPIDQVIEATNLLRSKEVAMVAPYDGVFVSVDSLFKTMFGKLLDPILLTLNKNKFYTSVERSWGGCAFISKEKYQRAGLENEFISSWGPEDVERPKRLKNLGFKVNRIKGPLFHLPHERKENSGYSDLGLYYQFMEEYLKICNMHKPQLEQYVKSWPWIN